MSIKPENPFEAPPSNTPQKEIPFEERSIWQKIFSQKMLLCVFLGFSSGMPLFLMLNLIPAWFRTEGIDLKTISAMALAQLPFTIKFLWAPAVDRFNLFPKLGRHRSWMILSQMGVMISIACLGILNPKLDLSTIVMVSLLLCIFAGTQDIVIDAFRKEILDDDELGLGNSIHVSAYRLSAFVPGMLSLILADHLSWFWVFNITAIFMLVGIFCSVFLVKEPTNQVQKSRTLVDSVVLPFQDFFSRKGIGSALLILVFILLYKLGDSMATSMLTPFYMDMGYSKTEIGIITKNAALWPMIVCGILGGIWMVRLGINKALWIFGVVQMATILGFVWLSSFGHFEVVTYKELSMLALVLSAEYAGVGLGTAAFLSYISKETNPAFTATQFALLTSLSAVPRTFINSTAGWIIESIGYYQFYWFCFFLAIPGMLLLLKVAPWHGDTIKKDPAI